MAKFDSPLNNIKIASPCSQDWDSMVGGDRRRYCGECRMNVYNLSGMTRSEAEDLLLNAEGRLCVRYYRRADGTVLTKDCPVGWANVKKRAAAFATAFASLFFTFFGALGFVWATRDTERHTVGKIVTETPRPTPRTTPESTPKTDQPPVTMGAISPAANREENLRRMREDDSRNRDRKTTMN